MPKGHPKLCHHKGRELGYVTLDGRERYFRGHWPRGQKSPPAEIHRQYEEAMAAWYAARAAGRVEVGTDPSVDELWLAYKAHAERKYHKNGRPTSELACVVSACRVAARLYGELPARLFGVAELETVREEFVRAGWNRKYVNEQTSRVKRMFREGARRKFFPASVWQDLTALGDLPPGQGPAESVPVEEVPDDVIEATVPFLPPSLRPLVRAHRLIGCRADEICAMRARDLRTDADPDDVPEAERCWLFIPASSKTGERYWVGPQARAVLAPLLGDPDAWLFPTRRRGRGCWSTASYRRAVARAVLRANERRPGLPPLPRWTPLQVRHRAAEEARGAHPRGIEATQARLRHKKVDVSQVYAHNLDLLGRDVARRLG